MTKPRRLSDFAVLCFLLLLPAFAAVSAEPAPPGEPPAKVEPAKSREPIPAEVKTAAEEGLKAFAKNDMASARTAFQKLLAIDPQNLTGLVNLGLVEYRLHHLDQAEKLLKGATRINPDAAFAWLALGMVYYGEEKTDAALAALAQAAVLEPKNPKVHNYMAVTIGKKGWYSGAESELQRAIELDPDYAEAHFNLAVFYLQRSPPAVELARRHYQKALDLGAAPDPMVEKELNAR